MHKCRTHCSCCCKPCHSNQICCRQQRSCAGYFTRLSSSIAGSRNSTRPRLHCSCEQQHQLITLQGHTVLLLPVAGGTTAAEPQSQAAAAAASCWGPTVLLPVAGVTTAACASCRVLSCPVVQNVCSAQTAHRCRSCWCRQIRQQGGHDPAAHDTPCRHRQQQGGEAT